MLVKRIGYILIIRSRAYKPISFLAYVYDYAVLP